MASTRRKAAALSLAVVGIAGLSLASAAQLNVNSQTLGAGTTVVASCDDAVDVAFTSSYDAATKKYVATGVTISNIADACSGKSLSVTVTTTGATPVTLVNNQSKTLTGTPVATQSYTFAGTDAANIGNVAVVIAG